MAFLSCELCSQFLIGDETEAFGSIKGARLKNSFSVFLLLAAVLFLFGVFQIGSQWILAAAENAPAAYYGHVSKAVLLYTWLPGIFGAVSGIVFSGLGRDLALALIAGLSLLFSPISAQMFSNSLIGFKTDIPAWLAISLYRFHWAGDPLYGVGVETVHFCRIIFWITLFAALYFVRKEQRIRQDGRLALLAAICLTVFFGFRFEQRRQMDSFVDMDPLHGLTNSDQMYYMDQEGAEEAAGFSLAAVDLELEIRDRLEAEATLRLKTDSYGLPSYAFTLYHGLIVKAVQDAEGRNVPYNREADRLILEPESPTESFRISYAGRLAQYYTNRQGIALPGYAAYWPMPGLYRLFDDKLNSVQPVTGLTPVDFHVWLDSPLRVVCSLPQTGKGTYAGTAETVTIYGGFFCEEEQDGVTVYSPALGKNSFRFNGEETEAAWRELAEKLGAEDLPGPSSFSAIFLLPRLVASGRLEKIVFAGNCLLQQSSPENPADAKALAAGYAMAQTRPDQASMPVYNYLSRYLSGFHSESAMNIKREQLEVLVRHDRGEALSQAEKKQLVKAQELFTLLLNYRMDEWGEEKLLPILYAYLREENKTVHPVDLLFPEQES
ncbi:MAG: hypothetical protein J5496_08345 [Lachnospiraceae bacterium]|nr:hypothetical protein [Lachnospiraceae bacterium]